MVLQLQAQLQEMETEKIALTTKLEDGSKIFNDLQLQHAALSDLLAAEKQALEGVVQAEQAKFAKQQVKHAASAMSYYLLHLNDRNFSTPKDASGCKA